MNDYTQDSIIERNVKRKVEKYAQKCRMNKRTNMKTVRKIRRVSVDKLKTHI